MLFWGFVLLVGAAAGAALLLVDTSPRASESGAAPVSGGPAATWTAGQLRAPEISLVDQNGAPLRLESYRGRTVVVTFIDPLCRDFCPLEARHLGEVVRSFPARSRPAIVAVSVNVLGDSRPTLLRAARAWNVGPSWRWGVGSDAQLARVWKAFHIGVLVTSKQVAGATVRDVVHTEASYVIDRSGYERAIFLWPYSADAVTRTIRALSPAP